MSHVIVTAIAAKMPNPERGIILDTEVARKQTAVVNEVVHTAPAACLYVQLSRSAINSSAFSLLTFLEATADFESRHDSAKTKISSAPTPRRMKMDRVWNCEKNEMFGK